MENAKLIKKLITKIEIEKLKESGGILSIFSKNTKKEIIDACLYKSDVIIALSDSSLIIYDMVREFQKLEINVKNIYLFVKIL
jgi:hypothetical protein